MDETMAEHTQIMGQAEQVEMRVSFDHWQGEVKASECVSPPPIREGEYREPYWGWRNR